MKAAQKVLDRAGLQSSDIDLWEVNEAFAAVAMAFLKEMDLTEDRVNVRGGAVALGHPIGASGARILVTLLHAMAEQNVRRGCAAICLGGGEATAMIVEREVEARSPVGRFAGAFAFAPRVRAPDGCGAS